MGNKVNLDKDEQDILKSVEKGEWKSIDNLQESIKRYSVYAKSALKKDKRINIRISNRDLEIIQRKAIEEGIPYQTLIASLIHKFTTGRLIENRSANRRS